MAARKRSPRSAGERKTPGPPPKGEREQVTLRLPVTHLRFYREQARLEKAPLNSWLTKVLARAADLDEPSYLDEGNNDQGKLFGEPRSDGGRRRDDTEFQSLSA